MISTKLNVLMMEKLSAGSAVLLLGEGDFSFSRAYVQHLSKHVTMTSSCLLSPEELETVHTCANDNIKFLEEQGVNILHALDATKLEDDDRVKKKQFNRIIFNFPHCGGKSNIKKNRKLIKDFFASAIKILGEEGDICVSFCRGQGGTPADSDVKAWYDSWQAVSAAAYQHLVLRELWPFSCDQYPEYSSTGFRSLDRSFYTGGALTYVFRRCDPLSVRDAQMNLDPGPILVSGHQYSITRSYVADKFSRNLLEEDGHPVTLTAASLLGAIGSETLKQIDLKSPVIDLDQVPAMNYDRLYRLSPVMQQFTESSPEDQGQGHHEGEVIVNTCTDHEKYSTGTFIPDTSSHDREDEILALRTSLLDQLNMVYEDLDPGKVNVCSGNCCSNDPTIDSNNLPVRHEMMFIQQGSGLEAFNSLKEILSKGLEKICDSSKQVIFTPEQGNATEHILSLFRTDHLYSLEVTYKSVNIQVTDACNQVKETGKPEIPKDTPKCRKISLHVGYIGSDNENKSAIAVLNMDALTKARYDIPDSRLLWSRDPVFIGQFSGRKLSDSSSFRPLSLYPPLWRHDLSFWEPKDFSEAEMISVIREITGDSLRKVLLVNKWEEPGSGRVSRCYREVYQSYDRAISHQLAHHFQNNIRSTLAEKLGFELR